jgi:hypothetical protein
MFYKTYFWFAAFWVRTIGFTFATTTMNKNFRMKMHRATFYSIYSTFKMTEISNFLYLSISPWAVCRLTIISVADPYPDVCYRIRIWDYSIYIFFTFRGQKYFEYLELHVQYVSFSPHKLGWKSLFGPKSGAGTGTGPRRFEKSNPDKNHPVPQPWLLITTTYR